MKYAIVIHKTGLKSFSVSSPDIDCCFAVGETKEEAVSYFRLAVEQYLKDLHEMGLKPPKPMATVATIEVSVIA